MRASIALTALLATLACAPSMLAHGSIPPADRTWPGTLTTAQNAVAGGRYADADQALSTFARRYPGAPQARETLYWRALFRLDPANHNRSTHDAVRELDAYLLDGGSAPHREEAQVLRRIALAVDSLGHAAFAMDTSPADTVVKPPPAATAHEQELQKENQKLKEQLDKINAELERIKKRLAAPKPDGR